jgi:hypothetical protein
MLEFLKLFLYFLILLFEKMVSTLDLFCQPIALNDRYLEVDPTKLHDVIDLKIMVPVLCLKSLQDIVA